MAWDQTTLLPMVVYFPEQGCLNTAIAHTLAKKHLTTIADVQPVYHIIRALGEGNSESTHHCNLTIKNCSFKISMCGEMSCVKGRGTVCQAAG